jgi:single-strand DNA-binding protein
MNNVTLSGNLTSDPELVDLGELVVCRMRLAVDNGRYPTTFIDVRAFEEEAYLCAEYLRKGRKVGVTGRLAFEEWRGDDGRKRQAYSVIGRVEFLDRARREVEAEPEMPVVGPAA